MEFKVSFIDEQRSTYLHSSSGLSNFTQQGLRAGYCINDFGRANGFNRNPNNVGEMMERGFERERIREETMAAEIARKHLLARREMLMQRERALQNVDEEVRRKMLMERERALQIVGEEERRKMLMERERALHSVVGEVRRRILMERERALQRVPVPEASSSMWFEQRLPIMHPFESSFALPFEERLSDTTRGREIGGLATVPLKRKVGPVISEMVDTSEIMLFERARKRPEIVGQGCLTQSVLVKSPERWLKHYSSSHKILLVGEGDFSFSTCLAKAFGFAYNMCATSLNSIGFLTKHYEDSSTNIIQLRLRGCTVMHDVDATKMADHEVLRTLKFDRIIFNFPLAGFSTRATRNSEISRNQKLVKSFFNNAKKMVNEDGEIHLTHKSNGIFLEWRIESLARLCRIRLKEEVAFNLYDYPGYNNKYGFGGDKNFNCNPSKTYRFVLGE